METECKFLNSPGNKHLKVLPGILGFRMARPEAPDATFEHIAQFVPKWEWQAAIGGVRVSEMWLFLLLGT